MVDQSSGNVPPGILEMLKIFLAASSRGEQSVLILETKDRTLTTKYRSVEVMTGTPACASTSISAANKKVNKARARRSKLRLEQFMNKKMLEKYSEQRAGWFSSCSKCWSHQQPTHC